MVFFFFFGFLVLGFLAFWLFGFLAFWLFGFLDRIKVTPDRASVFVWEMLRIDSPPPSSV